MTTRQIEFSRYLRKRVTPAESALWTCLRNRKLNGYRFARQVPIGEYVADFMCKEHKLIIELDGAPHRDGIGRKLDKLRSRDLAEQGCSIVRFWNREVLDDIDSVLNRIGVELERMKKAGQKNKIKAIRKNQAQYNTAQNATDQNATDLNILNQNKLTSPLTPPPSSAAGGLRRVPSPFGRGHRGERI